MNPYTQPFRGLTLDTSRNYYPVSDILRTLDAMSWVKVNAFLVSRLFISHELDRSTLSTGMSRIVRVSRLKLHSTPRLLSTVLTLLKKFTQRVMSNTLCSMLVQYVFHVIWVFCSLMLFP